MIPIFKSYLGIQVVFQELRRLLSRNFFYNNLNLYNFCQNNRFLSPFQSSCIKSLSLQPEKNRQYFQYIIAEKFSHLNTMKSPCTDYDDIGSSFTACVIENVVKITNCKVFIMYITIAFKMNDFSWGGIKCLKLWRILKSVQNFQKLMFIYNFGTIWQVEWF